MDGGGGHGKGGAVVAVMVVVVVVVVVDSRTVVVVSGTSTGKLVMKISTNIPDKRIAREPQETSSANAVLSRRRRREGDCRSERKSGVPSPSSSDKSDSRIFHSLLKTRCDV